jgi:hypothetical protein
LSSWQRAYRGGIRASSISRVVTVSSQQLQRAAPVVPTVHPVPLQISHDMAKAQNNRHRRVLFPAPFR